MRVLNIGKILEGRVFKDLYGLKSEDSVYTGQIFFMHIITQSTIESSIISPLISRMYFNQTFPLIPFSYNK